VRRTTSDYERIEKAIHALNRDFRRQPKLADLAAAAGLSEYHFHRLFRRWAGISPKRFLEFVTAEHARRLLAASSNVLDVALDAGLSGPGRLHDLTVNVHALTPGEIRRRGAGVTIRHGVHESPFGDCLIALTDRGVCGLSFGDPGAGLQRLRGDWPEAAIEEDPRATQALARRIFDPELWRGAGEPPRLLLRGTNFQVRVWEALLCVPPGAVLSYEALAARVGRPRAVRAAASAVADNPVAF
jgi:AraC family transcriptional regulator of adaptative response/methylated-DNA-[protein]-cysteine methyltransferase